MILKLDNLARPKFIAISSVIDLRNTQDKETKQPTDCPMDQYAILFSMSAINLGCVNRMLTTI